MHVAALEKWKSAKRARPALEVEREEPEIESEVDRWRGCSSLTWSSITIMGMILLVTSMVSLVHTVDRREVASRQAKDEGRSAGISADTPAPNVVGFEVEIVREGARNRRVGVIGQSLWEANVGDSVRVSARLDAPGYAYLLSLNAKGEVEVVNSAGVKIAPDRTDVITLPRRPDDSSRLADAPGMQAMVLLVSREPLPAFIDWPASRQLRCWRSIQVMSGAWRFDGKAMERLGTNGVATPAKFFEAPRVLATLCNAARNLEGIDACAIIAFPVRVTGY